MSRGLDALARVLKRDAKSYVLALGGTLASVGCCPSYAGYPASSGAVRALALKTDATPRDECELRLYIEHVDRDGRLGLSAVEVSELPAPGAAAVQASTQVSEGVCVKHAGQELSLPSRIVIAAVNIEDFGRICEGDPKPLPTGRSTCVWNHTFRNRYPFDFTFVANEGTIADYLSLARVYRNGSLIARYNSASKLENPQVLRLEAGELKVPNSPFTLHPPHLAALDLRVMPAGAELDESMLSESIVDYRERAKQRASALVDAVLPAVSPEFDADVKCAMTRVARLKAQAQALVDPAVTVPVLEAGCEADLKDAEGGVPSLRQIYDSKQALLEDKVAELTSRHAEKLSKIQEALPKVREFLASKQPRLADEVARVQPALARLDAKIEDAARTCDDTLELAQRLRSSTIGVLRDRETQARVYENSVAALEQQGSVFEQYHANPPPAPGERQLQMTHGNRFQYFMFAPWNAVPISLAPDGPAGELQLSNAIPIVDVAGFRVQWQKSRFADFRVGVGGMYFRDTVPKDGGSSERFHGAFQANLGLANFKFGLAWVPGTKQEGARNRLENELRLLIGSDLLKLISGNNVEAL